MNPSKPAVAAALMVAAAMSGCSGGGSAPSRSTPSPTSAVTALPHRGGLVGAVDSARLVAVCTNVRQASTAIAGGLPDTVAIASYDGAVAALRQAPASPELQQLADRWDRLRHEVKLAAAVRRFDAFCAREGS